MTEGVEIEAAGGVMLSLSPDVTTRFVSVTSGADGIGGRSLAAVS